MLQRCKLLGGNSKNMQAFIEFEQMQEAGQALPIHNGEHGECCGEVGMQGSAA
jgi:hypothetical protein